MESASGSSGSFIGIVDFTMEARWLFITESVADLLGFEPRELVGRPAFELVHPDEFDRIKQMHYDTIRQDKAAVLAYLRMRHKDPYRGYILCCVSRTVVHNVLVGSISFAAPGAKAMHNASTAQEVEIITPTAGNFEFRRWKDSSPMPPSPIPRPLSRLSFSSAGHPITPSPSPSPPPSPPASSPSYPTTTDPFPLQSLRTALILDRFSLTCPIHYISNDILLSTTHVLGRSFFDFVGAEWEGVVRSWVDAVKAWGVNERGHPSDGGFGFGKFGLCVGGRDSTRPPEPQTRRHSHSHRDSHLHRDSHSRKDIHTNPHTYSHATSRTQRLVRAKSSTGAGAGAGSGTVSTGTTGPTGESAATTGAARDSTSAATPVSPTTPAPKPTRATNKDVGLMVDAIFSAHSDGILVILRSTAAI